MEMLFWKGGKDSIECVEGYGSYDSKAKIVWTEDQEMEVRTLFEEYSQIEDNEKDIVECIMERMTEGDKTRGQIIRELKKQSLITSAKELKKKKVKRHVWTDEEEAELKTLYMEFRRTPDPVGNIMSAKTVPRSKPTIIGKLVSLGLVNNRTELHKRRSKKSKEDDSDSDPGDTYEEDDGFVVRNDKSDKSASDSSSEEEEEEEEDIESSESDKENNDVTEPQTPEDVTPIIKNLIDKGYKSQLMWIQRALKRVHDSRSSDVSVPIVPLTEENETAMEDDMFLSFLRKVGIAPPTNEQEAFWRIPAELGGDDLQQLIKGLDLNEDGEPINAHMIKTHKPQKKSKKKDKKKKQKKADKKESKSRKEEKPKKTKKKIDMLKALAEKRKTKRGLAKRRSRSPVAEPDVSSDEENVAMETEPDVAMETEPAAPPVTTPKSNIKEKSSSSSTKKRRVKRLIDSDSENSENDVPVLPSNTENPETIASDEEEEESQSQKRPLVFGDSSDEESQPSKRQKLSESDNDDDTPLSSVAPTSQSARGQKILDSDDDDDETQLSSLATKQSESFPATLYSQGPLDSGDSEEDDHVPLRKVLQKKNRIESDDED